MCSLYELNEVVERRVSEGRIPSTDVAFPGSCVSHSVVLRLTYPAISLRSFGPIVLALASANIKGKTQQDMKKSGRVESSRSCERRALGQRARNLRLEREMRGEKMVQREEAGREGPQKGPIDGGATRRLFASWARLSAAVSR